MINKHFSCSCYYTNFSGIICRHIFKVAAQLNLEELPQHLFFMRWRKDPNDNILAKIYKTFYNNDNIGESRVGQQNVENDYEDYKYLLNRIWYKVQQIVKSKPELAKNFYDLLDKSVKEVYTFSIQNNEKVKNPTTIKPKGEFFFKHYIFYLYLLNLFYF